MEDIKKKKLRRKPLHLKEMDTVRFAKSKRGSLDRDNQDTDLLRRITDAWNNGEDVRRQGARAYRMTYGDQWSDPITIFTDGHRKTVSMREYLEMEGHIPMQTNQIAAKVNTIVGVFIKEQNEPVCKARAREEQQYGELLTAALQANCDKNRFNKLMKTCVIDDIVRGLAVAKERYGTFRGREDSWTEYINPNFFFVESGMCDPRFWDATLMGCWYFMPFEQLASKFVNSAEDLELLKKIYPGYGMAQTERSGVMLTDIHDTDSLTFMKSPIPGWCAVAEVWTKEVREVIVVHDTNEGTRETVDASDREMLRQIEAINEERREYAALMGWDPEEASLIDMWSEHEEYWYCRIMAPDGTILSEFESPYPDKLHPFTVLAYPFVDGRINGYIQDAIDHQIAINRALVLNDWIARNQVKGFVMMPQELVPDELTNEEFVQGGIGLGNWYFYDSSKLKGVQPQVFHPGAVSYDVSGNINQLKQLMEESTAVSGAIMGKTPYSGTSAALFAQQTANSSTPLVSLLEDIRTFLEDVATKKAKNIAEFYTPDRFETIAGSLASVLGNKNMKFDKVRDIEFDMSIKNGAATMVSRDISNDQLIGFLNAGMIDLPTVLELGDFPYGDDLLQKLQARQAEMQAAQEGQAGAANEQAAKQIAQAQAAQQQSPYGVPVASTRPLVQ